MSLLDAVEFTVSDLWERVEMHDMLRGWYLHRLTQGVPCAAHEAVLAPVIARLDREWTLLMRRAGHL